MVLNPHGYTALKMNGNLFGTGLTRLNGERHHSRKRLAQAIRARLPWMKLNVMKRRDAI